MPFMAAIGFSTIFGSHTDKLSKLFVSPGSIPGAVFNL